MGAVTGGGFRDAGTTVECYLVDTPPAYGDTLDPRDAISRVGRYVNDALEERADPAEAQSARHRRQRRRRRRVGEGRGPPRGRGKPTGSGFDCRVDVALCLLPGASFLF